MKLFSKTPRLLFIIAGLLLAGVSQNASALPSDFAGVCENNGNLFKDQVISSVIVMGAPNNRRAYIEVGGKIIAEKDYFTDGTGEMATDVLLLHTAITASILGTPVDLCITGNTQTLYGINLKED